MEDRVDLVEQRHADAFLLRCTMQAGGVQHAFGHHARAGEDILQRASLAEQQAHAMIPAVLGVARGHEIAHAAEPVEGFHLPAFSDAQAHHLRQRPRHECGDGVVTQFQTERDARRDGVGVLHRTGPLGAGDVIGRVGAEEGQGEAMLHRLGDLVIRAGHHRSGGQLVGDFFRVIRPGEDRQRHAGDGFPDHLAHAAPRFEFDALGAGNQHACTGCGTAFRHEFRRGAHRLRRHHKDQHVRRLQRGEVGGDDDVLRQGQLRQVALVAARRLDLRHQLRITAPELHLQPAKREHVGERRAPASGADDCRGLDHDCGLSFFVKALLSVPARRRWMLER